MEKLLYIIIPIAYFIYQGYKNFQIEQEKARKRNSGNKNGENNQKMEPIIAKESEAVELKPDYKLNRKEAQIKSERINEIYEKTENHPQDYYNPEIPSAEVIANRLIHAKHPHGYTPPTIAHDEESDFDLRDAIIKEAILRRPY